MKYDILPFYVDKTTAWRRRHPRPVDGSPLQRRLPHTRPRTRLGPARIRLRRGDECPHDGRRLGRPLSTGRLGPSRHPPSRRYVGLRLDANALLPRGGLLERAETHDVQDELSNQRRNTKDGATRRERVDEGEPEHERLVGVLLDQMANLQTAPLELPSQMVQTGTNTWDIGIRSGVTSHYYSYSGR